MSELAKPLSQAYNAFQTTENVVESSEPIKEEIQEETPINLLEVKHIISALDLTSVKVGNCLVIMRSEFDLSLSGEPYIALMLLVDLKSGKYISRVWNQTVGTGSAKDKGKLMEACKNIFCQGRPCLGLPVADKPFPRKIAAMCKKVLGIDAGIDKTTCDICLKVMPFPKESNEEVKEESDSQPDKIGGNPGMQFSEGDSIYADDFEAGVEQDQEFEYEDIETHTKHVKSIKKPKAPSLPWGEKNFRHKCPYCIKTFGARSAFQSHRKKVHFYGAFDCRVCGFKANFATDLMTHMNQNCKANDPSASCPNCKKDISLHDIQAHYEDCVGSDEKNKLKAECPTCRKVLSSKPRLQEHMKIHMREQGLNDDEAKTALYFYCEQCGKKCTSTRALDLHKKNMHVTDQIPCPKCEKKFATYGKMMTHKDKEHKPWLQCEHCEYQTYSTQHLRKHQVKHSEPTIECSHCGKMFKMQKNLEIHIREHTGERPFQCNVCGKGFTASSTLLTHNKHVHKILNPRVKRSRNR